MRKLVKSLRTGLFLNRASGWTAKSSDAVEFAIAVAACNQCHERHYGGTATVIRFQNRRHDMEFPHPM